ncbi:MAG TPA: FAD-binding oxidoreductase [Solirubrobacteraceae bacterium]|nr:FAD-binding oxidoreductase [Solirubrobacteraceae bacterium]
MAEPPDMRWWGWGDSAHAQPLPEHALALLREQLGIDGARHPPVELDRVTLAAPALDPLVRRRLAAIVGGEGVRDDHAARVLHAAGKGYPDLVRLRAGRPEGAPDAVVYPSSHAQVRAVLDECAGAGVAVVPWGGGTSVVGGVAPVRGSLRSVVALDLRKLGRVLGVDEVSSTVTVQTGMRGPALEAALRAQGLTLGHYPQSFEYVSIGGCVATRSAGQASTGHGRLDELVLGLRCAAPAGDLSLPPLPASAAGPDLRELLVGSEGTLGVLTDVSLRVRPRPGHEQYEGMFFRSFSEGSEALRAAAQHEVLPDVARLSDEEETGMSVVLAGGEGLRARAGQAYLRARGYADGCLAIFGWDGEADEVDRRRAASLAVLRERGGLSVGSGPGRSWAASRFQAPYLRDELLDHRVMVETLETASQWSRLAGLYEAVAGALREALARRQTPPLVMCHISHVYETGASLYFTFLARQEEGREIEQWRAAKTAATDAIVAAGGTITHHHAVGRDHAPWLRDEIGELGISALRALKRELDPAGIMNPGKLLPG